MGMKVYAHKRMRRNVTAVLERFRFSLATLRMQKQGKLLGSMHER